MIRVFGAADRDFRSNGDKVLHPIRAKITKEDNGEYFLELTSTVDDAPYLVANNIIVANTPDGEQPFRIINPEKTRNRIELRANHVFFDSANYLIRDSYVVDKTCAGALAHLNAATEPASVFQTESDIANIASFRCVRTSLFDAVMTVLDRWGGHLSLDGYTIGIKNQIGEDRGVVVRYGKNLREIDCVESWDEVVTKILPVGTDGITLPEVYLTADVQYDIPYTKCVEFQQDIDQEDYKQGDEVDEAAYRQALIADLRAQATVYLNAHKYPTVTYSVQANVDRVYDVGDVIEVVDTRLGIDLLTTVQKYEYNCLLKKFELLEFGNLTPGLSDLLGDINASVSSQIEQSADTTRSLIDTAVSNEARRVNTILTGGNVKFDGQQILIGGANGRSMKLDSDGVSFGQNGAYIGAWTMQNVLAVNALIVDGQPYSPGGVSAASAKYEGATKSGVQNTWVSLPLSGLVSGGSAFSLSGDGIKVGSGVSFVLLFARVDFGEAYTTGVRKVRVQKNGSAVAEVTAYAYVGDTFNADMVGVLVPVAENDVLTLSAYPIDTADEIKTGASLTVLAVM